MLTPPVQQRNMGESSDEDMSTGEIVSPTQRLSQAITEGKELQKVTVLTLIE